MAPLQAPGVRYASRAGTTKLDILGKYLSRYTTVLKGAPTALAIANHLLKDVR